MRILNFLCVLRIQFYHVNWPQAFQLFQSSFFQVNMVNQVNEVNEDKLIFQDTEHQLQKNIFYHFLHYSFLLNPQ